MDSTNLLENVVVVPGFDFFLFGFVGISVHRITDKQEVEIVLEFDIDEVLQFGVEMIVAHSDDHHQFTLLVLRVELVHQMMELLISDLAAYFNADRVVDSPEKLELNIGGSTCAPSSCLVLSPIHSMCAERQ